MQNTITITPDRRHLTAQILLLIIAAVWGATFFMIKDATKEFSVLAFLALRFLLITVIMLPLIAPLRRLPTLKEWRWGLPAGLFLTFGYVFQTFAMRVIGSGRTGFITGLYVVIVPFLALILLRHRIMRRIGIGTALALIGLVVLGYAPGAAAFGDVLAFLCAVTYAMQIIIVGQFPKNLDWRVMTILQLACVGMVSLIMMPLLASTSGCDTAICGALRPFADPIPAQIPGNVLFAALFTGILASGVGFSIQIWAQKILSPSEAALIYAMESPFAALFGWLFLSELLTIEAIIGGGLILAGVIITSVKAKARRVEEAIASLEPSPGHVIATEPSFVRRSFSKLRKIR